MTVLIKLAGLTEFAWVSGRDHCTDCRCRAHMRRAPRACACFLPDGADEALLLSTVVVLTALLLITAVLTAIAVLVMVAVPAVAMAVAASLLSVTAAVAPIAAIAAAAPALICATVAALGGGCARSWLRLIAQTEIADSGCGTYKK